MSYDRLWERLLDFLNSWCDASEVEPGRIEVTIQDARGQDQLVEIVMTRDEWEGVVRTSWGDFDAAAQEVRRALLTRSHHEHFLICRDYQVVPSASPTRPAPWWARDRSQPHPRGPGRWIVSRDGDAPDEAGSQ